MSSSRLRGHLPPEHIQVTLRAMIDADGVRPTARKLDVGRDVVVSAAAGCRMLQGTILLLEMRLKALNEHARWN